MASGDFDARQRQLKAALERMTKEKNLASAQKKIQRTQRQARADAEIDQPNKPSVILRPSDMEGVWDTDRMLYTTLGGVVRAITDADIAAFKVNIQTAKDKFTGGIRPQQVIDWSLPADRKRATEQIKYANVFSRKGGVVRYITNSGPDSKVDRHYVDVEFVAWGSATTGAKPFGLIRIKNEIANGAVRFDCDCEHHRFRRRYIATLGKYNYGADEHGFPKITNPNLNGIACKHVLRVMQQILSPFGAQYIKGQIEKDRANGLQRDQTIKKTPTQIRRELERQQATAHHKRHAVVASDEKPSAIRRMRAQAIKDAKQAAEAEARQVSATRLYNESIKQLEAAHKAGLLSAEVYQNAIEDARRRLNPA